MNRRNKLSAILVSLTMVITLFIVNVTAIYAWYNGQGYSGKTMSYSRNIYIGAVDSSTTNYYGYMDESENFIYSEIDGGVGFQYNNLIPSSYIHLKTEIENTNATDDMIISLYLQEVIYDAPLNDYLYFGITDPFSSRYIYKDEAIYDEANEEYEIRSIPLLEDYRIAGGETLSLYWYVYIDSGAGMEIANTLINLGQTTLVYN
jgi:hypothetical protein